MKTLILMSCAVLAFVSVADVETIDELVLDEAKTIDVAAGNTKRIEYLSGTTAVTLTKTGEGTLELAVIGNTNATILVTAGTLKSVRPAKVTVNGNVYFHLDASDASSFEMETVNGTNFVTRVNDAAGGQLYATPLGSRPKPFYGDVTLNGLPVLDFGPYSRAVSGQGSALTVSTPAIINELFYVWQDHEGTKDNVPADTLGPNAVNMRYSYRGKGGAGDDFEMYYTAHGSISATTTVDGSKVGKDTPVGEGWHTAA